MTKYREILRLKSLGFSERNIAQSCGVSRNTVAKVLKKAAEINLSWPLDFDMTWILKAFRFNLSLQNALNQDSYSYSIYNSINTYTYNYKLRGRELLFTITMTL